MQRENRGGLSRLTNVHLSSISAEASFTRAHEPTIMVVGETADRGTRMLAMPLEKAHRALSEIVESLPPGEDVVLTRGGEPVATIRATTMPRGPRRFGTLKGS